MRTLLFRVVVLTVGLSFTQTRSAAELIYWVDRGGHEIRAAELDGSNPRVVLETGAYPNGMDADLEAGTIYWTEHNSQWIHRANLDGSDTVEVLQTDHTPVGLALDVGRGKMYWGENWVDGDGVLRGSMNRANLDGSGVEQFISDIVPLHIALDLSADQIYWTDRKDQPDNVIARANLDGSGVETLVGTTSRGRGLALDVSAGKMYWTAYADGVFRCDLDGGIVEHLVDQVNTVGALALDMDRDRLLVAAEFPTNPSIFQSNLDGTDWEAITPDAGFVTAIVIVPEATTVSLLALGAIGVMKRRR